MRLEYINLLRHKFKNLQMYFRIYYLKVCGMSIGKMPLIGSIQCDWPNKIIIGDNCELRNNILFGIQRPFNESTFIKIGNRVFIGNDCEFNVSTIVSIGDDCLIASRTIFVDAGHEIQREKKIKIQGILMEAICVEEDVWIGTNCKILKGVTIGKGSVIGAGSVVNKSIPPYQIWAGSPARFIRNR